MASILKWYMRRQLSDANVSRIKDLLREVVEEVHRRRKVNDPNTTRLDTQQAINTVLTDIRTEARD